MPFDNVARATPESERKSRAQKYTSGTQTNVREEQMSQAAKLRARAAQLERRGSQRDATEAARLREQAARLE